MSSTYETEISYSNILNKYHNSFNRIYHILVALDLLCIALFIINYFITRYTLKERNIIISLLTTTILITIIHLYLSNTLDLGHLEFYNDIISNLINYTYQSIMSIFNIVSTIYLVISSDISAPAVRYRLAEVCRSIPARTRRQRQGTVCLRRDTARNIRPESIAGVRHTDRHVRSGADGTEL